MEKRKRNRKGYNMQILTKSKLIPVTKFKRRLLLMTKDSIYQENFGLKIYEAETTRTIKDKNTNPHTEMLIHLS